MTDLVQRLQLIWIIVWKDLARARTPMIACTVIAVILGLLIAPLPMSIVRFGPARFTWSADTLRVFYAAISVLTSMSLGLTFYAVHGGEIRKGTIRSIILYPVDANDIAIAKLASAFIMSLLLCMILLFGPLGAFFVLGVLPFPDFGAILLMSLAVGFVSLTTGVFLAHALAHLAKRMVVSPSGLGALFLLSSILLTEFGASTIAFQVLDLSARSRGTSAGFQDFQAAQAFGRVASVLSPHHWGARLLSLAFGVFPAGGELPIVISVALTALAIAAGYLWGKKLYLDAFIQ
ncbi:MAG: hypothetical protein E6K10_05450 [Methanobacteriota archaeon]|nr:MAG: hypothetical protein E6K10_05450 [Euryarchaeota archaeon]